MKTMKYSKVIKGLGCVLLSIALLSSCEDYLTVEPTSSISPDNFYKTEAQADQALMGVFNGLYKLPYGIFTLNEVRSDNICAAGAETDNGEASCVAYFGDSGLPDRACVSTAWNTCSNIIAAANLFLDNMDRTAFKTDKMKAQYAGQARFLRALAYFYMVRWFGNVPISTTTAKGTDIFSIGLSPAHEVYNQVIIPDLQYAADNLLDDATNYKGTVMKGRATRWAAYALLGEAYVTMAGYPFSSSDYNWSGATPWNANDLKTKAAECLKKVIDYSDENGKYWAANMTAWNKMWLHEQDNTLFVFEIQYATDANGNSAGNQCTPYVTTQSANGQAYYGGRSKQMSSYNYQVSPVLRNYFLQKTDDVLYTDQRAFCSVTTRTYQGGKFSGYASDGLTYEGVKDDVLYLNKFWENKAKRDSLLKAANNWSATELNNSTSVWPQNFPLVRLENVILLYAEIMGRSEGIDYLNRTHTRAGLPAYTAADFATDADYQEAVLTERRYELASEGHRWFDLVRTNTFVTALQKMFQDAATQLEDNNYNTYATRVKQYHYLFPIPQAQLDIVGGVYKQNPGYN